MSEILLSSTALPVVCACDSQTAYKSFCIPECKFDYNVVIYIVDGTMYISENGTEYEINEGELFFVKHNEGSYKIKGTKPGTKWYYAHFYLDEPSEDIPAFGPDSAPLVINQALRYYETLPKRMSGLKNGYIERKFAELVDFCHAGDSLKRMRINNMFYSFLADIALMKYMNKTESSLSYKIRGWLDKHYAESFSAEKLEKEFYIGYKRMAAVFKQEYGMTMQQYHNTKRMQIAAHLLKTTLLPIGDIAGMLGFEDRLYFSRCFHVFSGVSPKEYRQSEGAE